MAFKAITVLALVHTINTVHLSNLGVYNRRIFFDDISVCRRRQQLELGIDHLEGWIAM